MIKKFNEFWKINEDVQNEEDLYISKVSDDEIYVLEDKIKEIFGFLGEGIDDIDFSSVYSPSTDHYTNDVYITFFEHSWGGHELEELKKADEILKKMEGKHGIEHYIVEGGKITIHFEDNLPLAWG